MGFDDDLASWLVARLVVAGFDPDLAVGLARQSDLDVHQLLALVDAGCPPKLAARIVAPL
jgi:hypothetical protein